MPHVYFEADGLASLQSAYDRALAILEKHQSAPAEVRDILAARIFRFAADGVHSEEAILKAALTGFIPADSFEALYRAAVELAPHPEP